MTLPTNDRAILRECAREIAEIAALPVQREKAELWRKLNDLERVRPMVWIDEHPWHEMNVNDELTLRCEDEWARRLEKDFRRNLYCWRHARGDMIVEGFIASPKEYHHSGYGLEHKAEIVRTDATSNVVSRHFIPQIVEPKDIEKIQMPRIDLDERATAEEYDKRCEIFADILPVTKVGIDTIWFTPWDTLIGLWGVEQALLDLVMRPEMVNVAVERWVDANMYELDQYEALNLLSLNNSSVRVGSGGYGYTNALPGPDFDPRRVRPQNMWGCGNAQVFSEVSPDMHWEFAMRHELRYMERWGMNYYGCCEPLDRKMHILERIPNLRKVSMSPKVDPARGAEAIGRKYVYSMKPNPAILAVDRWRPEQVRLELGEALEKTRGCNVEIIMKDVSTVRYEPKRLWEWAAIAVELAEELA